MPRVKDLTKKPVKYFTEALLALLKKNGDEALLTKVHFSAQTAGILKINCYDEATLAKLKPYQRLITAELLKPLGLQRVVLRCQPQYATFKILDKFEQSGVIEFTLDQLLAEMDADGEYCIEVIKSVLRDLTVDLELHPYHENPYPAWLVPMRQQAPMIECLKSKQYRLFRKPKVEKPPAPGKKTGSKKAKQA